jgi:hypothetical protein
MTKTIAFRRTMMRKNIYWISVVCIGLFASCISVPKDRGIYNPNSVPEEQLSTLYIHDNIDVQKMDEQEVDWNAYSQKQIVRIPSGVHAFTLRYNDGVRFTPFPMTVIGQFDSGKTYILKGVIDGQRVKSRIARYENEQEGEDVTLDLNKLQGNDPSVISTYIKYILNPTMDEVGNSVKLENEEYVLLYLPDMVYTLTDKKTGETTQGRRGFSMDFRMTSAKIFLLETDINEMSKEQFLKSEYEDNAQIVLIPIQCSENEVTYRYERPSDLQGVEIVFNITEIKK